MLTFPFFFYVLNFTIVLRAARVGPLKFMRIWNDICVMNVKRDKFIRKESLINADSAHRGDVQTNETKMHWKKLPRSTQQY